MPSRNRIMLNRSLIMLSHNSRGTRSLRSRTMRLSLITPHRRSHTMHRRLSRTMRLRHLLRLRIRLRALLHRIDSTAGESSFC